MLFGEGRRGGGKGLRGRERERDKTLPTHTHTHTHTHATNDPTTNAHLHRVDVAVLVRREREREAAPRVLDAPQLLLDRELLLRAVDDLGARVDVVVQLEREQVAKAEARVDGEALAGRRHEHLPVALAHRGVVQVLHERQAREHRLERVLEQAVRLVVARRLVQRARLLGEPLGLLDEAVDVDLVPRRLVPVVGV